ncbi:hypothetical protein BJ742DRAFT_682138 [Cladochytrium replicatum]|nr:hypothetical protein BJ742DRAFT_682138 [Cladochytrium replicatum]
MLQRAVVPGGNLNNSPPSKVVRAIASYRAMKNGELSFNSGEFFYVINDSHPRFLDVINPQTKQRGIVPVDFFEILDRADPPPIAQSPRYNNHDDDRRYMNGGRDPAARDAVSPPRSGYPDIVPPSPSQRHLDDRYLRSPSPVKTAGDRSQFLQPPSSPPSNAPIVSVAIQAYERRQDGHYLFTLEVKREDQARSLLFRVYDDIYILHISLLTHFPSESGRSDSVSEPRIIPLLQPPVPSASLNPNSLRQLVSHLNVYFEELLHLPPHMLNSAPMKRFFVLRPAPAAINNGRADIETPLDEQMDVSATLIDMIHDYTDEGLIPIKVSFQNDNWVWKVFDSVGYQEFIEDIEKRLGMRRNAVRKVQYRDETGALVRLKGDLDLRILLRTSYSRLCFFVE